MRWGVSVTYLPSVRTCIAETWIDSIKLQILPQCFTTSVEEPSVEECTSIGLEKLIHHYLNGVDSRALRKICERTAIA
jgi:hypothetical protein